MRSSKYLEWTPPLKYSYKHSWEGGPVIGVQEKPRSELLGMGIAYFVMGVLGMCILAGISVQMIVDHDAKRRAEYSEYDDADEDSE